MWCVRSGAASCNKRREFWRETHTPLWLLIGRIIFFTCENHRSLLWLARANLRTKIYDIAFWWVFLSMYIIKTNIGCLSFRLFYRRLHYSGHLRPDYLTEYAYFDKMLFWMVCFSVVFHVQLLEDRFNLRQTANVRLKLRISLSSLAAKNNPKQLL